MTTKETVQDYFERLSSGGAWDALLAEDVAFTRLTDPVKRVTGKDEYIEATRRFYASVGSLEVRESIVEGNHAAVLTRYEVRAPTGGARFESYVAEFFEIQHGQIKSLAICFDTAPYPKR